MSLAVVTPLGTLESGLALGDRLKALRGVLDFIRGLGIDQAELFALARMLVPLFKTPTLEGAFAFLEALLKAMESAGPAPAGTPGGLTAAAINWMEVFTLIQLIFDLVSRWGKPTS